MEKKETVEFYRHTLEKVYVNSIKTILPDTKNPLFEKYGHLEEVSFTYKRISWLYHEGYLLFTDEWNESLFEKKEAVSFTPVENHSVQPKPPEPLKITFTEGKIRGGREGLVYGKPFVVRFKASKSRDFLSNENKVDIRIYAIYNKSTEQKQVVFEERLPPDGIYERTFQSLEKHFQSTSADEKVEYYATITSPYAEGVFRSESVFMPYEKKICIPWIIDCHMHINSGHAAPLPLQWSNIPGSPHFSQATIDALGDKVLGKFGKIQKESTVMIGKQVVTESKSAIDSKTLEFMGDTSNRRRLMTVLPMDMDYAHYKGYEGIPIYEKIDGEIQYWGQTDKKYHKINTDDYQKWVKYSKQLSDTRLSFYNEKGALIPFYHYDPRSNLKNWREPFSKNLVQTANPSSFPKNMPAIGIKMYTALGYRPMDAKLNFPWTDYYELITNKKIPIICHGGRGGMITHDIVHYYEHEHPNFRAVTEHFKKTWFYNQFISPYAWEEVLKRFPDLFLCLAHFGGDEFWIDNHDENRASSKFFWEDLYAFDLNNWIPEFLYLMKTYPNFYVDLSYFILRPSMIDYFKQALMYHPDIKKKLLFGTDWWLYTMEKGYGSYNSYLSYIENFSNMVISINDNNVLEKIGVKSSHELLAYFFVLNPLRFLQLKTVIPKVSKFFHTFPDAKSYGWKFEPDEWIHSIPENVEDFYT